MGETVTLQDNNGDNLAVSMDGSFTFATPLVSGAAFHVTLFNFPLNLMCGVTAGSGTIGNGNVSTVVVMCLPAGPHAIFLGGTVTGLAGTLVLENNGGNPTTISSNGPFMFSTAVVTGATYDVTIATQPGSPVQVCTVTNGTGTMTDMNVTNVAVNCVTTAFTVGLNITGLSGTIVLADNATDMFTETTNGTFAFATPVPSGSPYAVTVVTQPAGQTCTVTASSGILTNANVGRELLAVRRLRRRWDHHGPGPRRLRAAREQRRQQHLLWQQREFRVLDDALYGPYLRGHRAEQPGDTHGADLHRRQRVRQHRNAKRELGHRHLRDQQLHDLRVGHPSTTAGSRPRSTVKPHPPAPSPRAERGSREGGAQPSRHFSLLPSPPAERGRG